MRFTLAGVNYLLEFERQYKNVTLHKDGEARTIRSTYPFTTAKLLEVRLGKEPGKIAQAVVGCAAKDQFSNADGRLWALKLLSTNLRKSKAPKELIAKVWNVYLNRGNTSPKSKPETMPEEGQKINPAINPEASLT